MTNEEKQAMDKLKAGKKIGIYELIRTFKREGIENFVTTRKKYADTILNLIEKQSKEIEGLKEKNKKAIDFINERKKTVNKDMAEGTKLQVGTFMWQVDELLEILKEEQNNVK